MDSTGYVYVPERCAKGALCKVETPFVFCTWVRLLDVCYRLFLSPEGLFILCVSELHTEREVSLCLRLFQLLLVSFFLFAIPFAWLTIVSFSGFHSLLVHAFLYLSLIFPSPYYLAVLLSSCTSVSTDARSTTKRLETPMLRGRTSSSFDTIGLISCRDACERTNLSPPSLSKTPNSIVHATTMLS